MDIAGGDAAANKANVTSLFDGDGECSFASPSTR